MNVRRLVVVVVLAMALGLSLQGCETNLALGPIAVKRSGDHMLIAVCTDVHVKEVGGDLKLSVASNHSTTFLEGSGSRYFERGDVVVTGRPWKGIAFSKNANPSMSNGVVMAVYLTPRKKLDEFSGSFAFGSSGLSSSRWLHPDGRSTAKPCDGVPVG